MNHTHDLAEWAAFLSLGVGVHAALSVPYFLTVDADLADFDPRPAMSRLVESGRLDLALITVANAKYDVRETASEAREFVADARQLTVLNLRDLAGRAPRSSHLHSGRCPMIHSNKPDLSWEIGASHLRGVLRADRIRTDTLTQLVQHWADPQSRDDIIDALDELAAIVTGVAREGELDAAVEQVEDMAGMDTAQVEVDSRDVRRLLAEATEVARVVGRFAKGASEIKHPAMLPTRLYLKASPLPEQQDRRTA